MKIFSMIMGALMIFGFKLKHVDDDLNTEKGVFIFAVVYILCATTLIVAPIIVTYLESR